MRDPFRADPADLPTELRALDEALTSVRFEERSSFGPELRAELEAAADAEPSPRPSSGAGHRGPALTGRTLVAAGLAALLLAGVAVPQARASLVLIFEALKPAPPAAVEPPAGPPAPVTVPELPVMPSPDDGAAPAPREEPVGPESGPGTASIDPSEVGGPSAPTLVDPALAESIFRGAYPVRLQERGVGGTVQIRLWVDAEGRVELPQVAVSSGVPDLDSAALRAADRLEFEPGYLGATPIGTWIEFPVRFEPRGEDEEGPAGTPGPGR